MAKGSLLPTAGISVSCKSCDESFFVSCLCEKNSFPCPKCKTPYTLSNEQIKLLDWLASNVAKIDF